MRTTLNLEKPVLDGLKALQKKEKRSLSRIASELLAEALGVRQNAERRRSEETFAWNSAPMRARVDLRDTDALYRILDETPA